MSHLNERLKLRHVDRSLILKNPIPFRNKINLLAILKIYIYRKLVFLDVEVLK